MQEITEKKEISFEDERREIDFYDKVIFRLIEKRQQIARKIIKEKAFLGIEITDEQREEQIIKKLTDRYMKRDHELIETVMKAIFKNSKSIVSA